MTTIVIVGLVIVAALLASYIYEITHSPDENKMR